MATILRYGCYYYYCLTLNSTKMDYKELKAKMHQTMQEFGFKTNKLAVELCGKLVYLTETEIRALQVMCKRNPSLRDDIVVYDGRTKRGSKILQITEDGYFDEPPTTSIFSVNTKLFRALM